MKYAEMQRQVAAEGYRTAKDGEKPEPKEAPRKARAKPRPLIVPPPIVRAWDEYLDSRIRLEGP